MLYLINKYCYYPNLPYLKIKQKGINMQTLLSIIIPVYNAENHVDRTLSALCKQIEDNNYSDIRLIIVNDASTDKSTEIITNYDCKPYVNNKRLIKRVSTGEARNIGISIANNFKSKYVGFCDSDDILNLTVARNIALKLNNKCPVGIGHYEVVDYKNTSKIIKTKRGIYKNNNCEINKVGKDISLAEIFMLTNAGTWNKIYNLEFLIQNDIKFANTNYAEDASFVYQVLCSTSSIYLSNEILYKYSDPDTNPCSNVNKASSTWEQLFVAMEKVWEKIVLLPDEKQIILCESFINSMIGHIRYA